MSPLDSRAPGSSNPSVPEGYLPTSTGGLNALGLSAWGGYALNPAGERCFVKATRFATPELALEARRLRQRVMEAGGIPGLIGLRSAGLGPDRCVVWEELEPADLVAPTEAASPEGLPPRAETLVDRLRSGGPWSAGRTLALGLQLCGTLRSLHGLGLLHGDIKPANILFKDGQPILADLGLLRSLDFNPPEAGTLGYLPTVTRQPVEVDLFALGKSLYEIWTGQNRYQFPSLPPGLGRDPDWNHLGWRLNRVLLRTADHRPSSRLGSADELESEMVWASRGGRQWSRRQFLEASAMLGTMTAGGYFWRNRPEFEVRCETLPPERFGAEAWVGSAHTVDWRKRRVYSLQSNQRLGLCFGSYSLENWGLQTSSWKRLPAVGPGVMDPESRHLWASAEVSGELIRLDPDHPKPEELEVAPFEDLNFTGPPYWNPKTRRPGRFAGYGYFKVVNRRWEWDSTTRSWQSQPSGSSDLTPLPRTHHLVFPGQDRSKLWFFGGEGNSSGQQGVRESGLRGFNGNWHPLDDLWQLDLATSNWRQVLPLGGNIPHLQIPPGFGGTGGNPGFAELASSRRLMVVRRSANGSNQMPTVFVLDPNVPEPRLSEARLIGKPPALHRIWMMLAEPDRDSALLFSNRGVFRLTLRRL